MPSQHELQHSVRAVGPPHQNEVVALSLCLTKSKESQFGNKCHILEDENHQVQTVLHQLFKTIVNGTGRRELPAHHQVRSEGPARSPRDFDRDLGRPSDLRTARWLWESRAPRPRPRPLACEGSKSHPCLTK